MKTDKRVPEFRLHMCEYWRADALHYGYLAGAWDNLHAKAVDVFVAISMACDITNESRYIPVIQVDFEDLRRIWVYHTPLRKWILTYSTNEEAGNFIVETEKVNDSANETTEGCGQVQD